MVDYEDMQPGMENVGLIIQDEEEEGDEDEDESSMEEP